MRPIPRLPGLLLLVLLPAAVLPAASALDGRWTLDRTRSTALDGWTAWDLVITTEGSRVTLRHDLQWYSTKFSASNTVDLAQTVRLPEFFRVEQRHMAVYRARDGATTVQAGWIDAGRTLRLEAETPVEISQGTTPMRIYSEYRLLEGGRELLLIELHHTRPTPLVYRFTKATEEK